MASSAPPADVDAYIAQFPPAVRKRLAAIRAAIRAAAPDAEEVIAYGMAGYRLNGPLVYFAGFANHVGFYATPTGHAAFAEELAGYRTGKGSVQFPHDAGLPLDLVRRMVAFRAKENAARGVKTAKTRRA